MSTDRREFLKLLTTAAASATLPASIARGLAIPANNQTASINDVEHVVFLMQENRSFDHYFGTLRGVRGFGDPRAVKLPSGKSVWHQPDVHKKLPPRRKFLLVRSAAMRANAILSGEMIGLTRPMDKRSWEAEFPGPRYELKHPVEASGWAFHFNRQHLCSPLAEVRGVSLEKLVRLLAVPLL